MLKRVARILTMILSATTAVAVAVIVIFILVNYDPQPLSTEEISRRVERLNQGAGVDVPHQTLDDGKTRQKNLALFESVERSTELSDEDSAKYRLIYQQLLFENQAYLARFDKNLTVLPNVGMDQLNNVHGHGIEGNHDHHDQSARSNYLSLIASLRRIKESKGISAPVIRIKNAVTSYKDLTDIILHLATVPQTKSVPYVPPTELSGEPEDEHFETLLREYKEAQFQPVNSAAYREHIILALNSYDRLVESVQRRIFESLHPAERTVAGNWGSWQSLSPDLDKVTSIRISRHKLPE